LRWEVCHVAILNGEHTHVVHSRTIRLIGRRSGSEAGTAESCFIVVLSTSERCLGLSELWSGELLLTHMLVRHIVTRAHCTLVSSITSHTLSWAGSVHVIHAVMVHVGVTATHVTWVVAASSAMSSVTSMTIPVTAVVVHAQVHHTLLSLVTTSTVVILMSVLLPLQLGLYTLAVRGVADHRENGPDVINKL
jgi:hypothetical protein